MGLADQLQDFRSAHTEESVAVGDHEIRYIRAGTRGPVVLYLPGGTGEAEVAFQYIDALEEDLQVVAVSYPSVASIEELCDAIAAVVRAVGEEQVDVWGTSFGGMVAQWLAWTRPQVVRSLILSNTSAPLTDRVAKIESQDKLIRVMPKWLMKRVLKKALGRSLAGLDRDAHKFWDAYLAKNFLPVYREKVALMDAASLSFYRDGQDLAAESRDEPWRERVLILSASDDELYGTMHEELVAMYPHARVQVFEGGHASSSSRATDYAAEVKRFLLM